MALDSYTPVSLLRPGLNGPAHTDGSTKAIRKAAEDFEASFISALLQPVFDGLSTEAPFGGGDGEAAFKSLMVDAFARQTARSGGVGLAASIQAELLKMQGGQ